MPAPLVRGAYKLGKNLGQVRMAFADGMERGAAPRTRGKDQMIVGSAFLTAAQMDMALTNPSDLIEAHGMSKIDEMRCEETIYATENALFKTRLRTGWEIVPPEGDPKDERHLAGETEWMLRAMVGTLNKNLLEMWTARAYGFSVTHKRLMVRETPFGQRQVIDALMTKEPHAISFKLDEWGNFKPNGLIQTVEGEDKGYDPADFVIFSWDQEFGNPYGRTAYRNVYRAWFCKKWNLKFLNIALERHAGGLIILGLPATFDSAVHQTRADEVLESIQNGTELQLPDGYTLDVKETSGAGLAAYDTAIKMHNFFIATGLLAPEHLGYTETEGGSYAKAEVQRDLWLGVCEDLGEETGEAIMDEQIIKPYIDMNYPNVEEYPRFRFKPLVEEDKWEMIAKVIEAMRQGGGKILTWTDADEDHIRDKWGLPELPDDLRKRREDEEKTVSVPEPTGGGDDTEGGEVPGGEDVEPEAEPPQSFAAFPKHVFSTRKRRAFTRYERHVNFAQIEDHWDEIDKVAIEAISGAVGQMKTELVGRVDKLIGGGKYAPDPRAVKKLKLRHVRDVELGFKSALLMGYLSGKFDVRNEYERAMGEQIKLSMEFADSPSLRLIPAEARRYFKGLPLSGTEASMIADKAFFITGVERDVILKECKMVLYKGLEKGDPAWTRTQLRRVFDKYLETGELKDGALSTAWRAETIVRTNLADAYNQGRMGLLRDDAVDQAVEAYQYTAVLDNNTTDYCAAMDNHVFDKDEIEAPPAHMNCRSFLVPVFTGETFSKTTQADVRDDFRKASQDDRKVAWREKPVNPDRISRATGF